MAISIKGGNINGCETGISAPASADMVISDIAINRCKKAIDLRDPPSIIEQLGLPKNTPPHLVIEAINTLKQSENDPPEKQIDVFKSTNLFNWLSLENVANLSTIAENFTQLSPRFIEIIYELL